MIGILDTSSHHSRTSPSGERRWQQFRDVHGRNSVTSSRHSRTSPSGGRMWQQFKDVSKRSSATSSPLKDVPEWREDVTTIQGRTRDEFCHILSLLKDVPEWQEEVTTIQGRPRVMRGILSHPLTTQGRPRVARWGDNNSRTSPSDEKHNKWKNTKHVQRPKTYNVQMKANKKCGYERHVCNAYSYYDGVCVGTHFIMATRRVWKWSYGPRLLLPLPRT